MLSLSICATYNVQRKLLTYVILLHNTKTSEEVSCSFESINQFTCRCPKKNIKVNASTSYFTKHKNSLNDSTAGHSQGSRIAIEMNGLVSTHLWILVIYRFRTNKPNEFCKLEIVGVCTHTVKYRAVKSTIMVCA